MKGEKELIEKILQTEINIYRSIRDGSALMQHMEDFYYITLLEVRECVVIIYLLSSQDLLYERKDRLFHIPFPTLLLQKVRSNYQSARPRTLEEASSTDPTA